MYADSRPVKPSMITATTSPKSTKIIQKSEFESYNLQEQVKLNDIRHKEIMKETLLRKKRKEKQIEDEKIQKEVQQQNALRALREERKEQYNKFLKQAVIRNKSCNNSKLQSVVSPDIRMQSRQPLGQIYSRPVDVDEFKGSENSFERLERQVNVKFNVNRYNDEPERGNRSDHSVDKELDEILERNMREQKLQEEKANKRLVPNSHMEYQTQGQPSHKPSIENFLEEKPESEDLGAYSYKPSNEASQFTMNSRLQNNDSTANKDSRFHNRFKITTSNSNYAKNVYEDQEQRLKNSIRQINTQLPSDIRNNHNIKKENDILASLGKLDELIKNKQKSLQEIKKRPKSMFSLQDQANPSKLGSNNLPTKKQNAYYSDMKGPKDILSGYQMGSKPSMLLNPYSQMQPIMNPYANYGGFGMMPHYQAMPISVISAPSKNRQDEDIDFDAVDSNNLKHDISQTEKRIIKDLDEIGKVENIGKENHNMANMKKLRPISLINETNSYSVLTDVMPGRTDIIGTCPDKSYFQRRNMQKNMMNKGPTSKTLDTYKDGYEFKGDEEGRIQYHPNKLKELFED